jgi:hypothetical protein
MWTDRRKDGQTDGVMVTQTDRHDESNCRFSQFCEVTSAGNSEDLH